MVMGSIEDRIKKMKEAIQEEAKQRAQYLVEKAEEEADIQRNSIIKAEREKTDKEYTQLAKIEKVKAKIEKSTMINHQRLRKMEYRHQLIEELKNAVKEQLQIITNNEAKYAEFMKKLVVQGMLKMMERNIYLQGKLAHRKILEGCIKPSERLFFQTTEKLTGFGMESKLTLSEYNLEVQNKNIIGGVFMRSRDGNIVCNNSLDARIGLIFEHLLPTIRENLFKHK